MSATNTGTKDELTGRQEYPQPQSPLLNLPGEVRNHIYSYLTDDLETLVRLTKLQNEGSSSSSSKPPRTWANMRRQSFGFTQVCRLVRHEILPLYRHGMWPNLRHTDVIDYTLTISPIPAKANGTVTIYYPHWREQGQPIDIAPLVRLAAKSKELLFLLNFITIFPEDGHEDCIEECEDCFDRFLDPHKNRKGLLRAANLFKEIYVQGGDEIVISAKVYAAYAKPWMPQRYVLAHGGKDEATEMLESIGLRGQTSCKECTYKIDICVEEGENEEDVVGKK